MGYLGSSNGQNQQRPTAGLTQNVSWQKPKAPEPERLDVNLDPSNPVETVFGGIGGLFQGVVGAGVGIADALSKVPVIGDVGKGIAAGLGAFGEVGIKGVAQVKDVAKGALDLVSIPGQVVERGAAAIRASEVFGDLPQDVKSMMGQGKSFGDVVDYLATNHRGFSDDPRVNLGFALVTDPLNYVNPAAPILGARHVAKLAKVESAAFSKADEIIKAGKVGGTVDPQFEALLGKRAGDIRKEVVARYIDENQLRFLNRWRIAGELYDSTLGKAGRGMSAMVDAIRTPVVIGMTRALDQAPKNVIEGLNTAGKGSAASVLAKNLGRGLTHTAIFAMSNLFSKFTSNVGKQRALYILKKAEQGRQQGMSAADVVKLIKNETDIITDDLQAEEMITQLWGMTDAQRRHFVREAADGYARSEVTRASKIAQGDYKVLQQEGGIRMVDTIEAAQDNIATGSFKYTNLDAKVQRDLFVRFATSASRESGRVGLARTFANASNDAADDVAETLGALFDKHGVTDADRIKLVQLAEIAAYGAAGTNTAVLRSAIRAIAAGDKAKLEDILKAPMTMERFTELKKFFDDPDAAKFARLNVIREDSLTKEVIEALVGIGKATKPEEVERWLSVLPEAVRNSVKGAAMNAVKGGAYDEFASAIAKFFPDIHSIVMTSSGALWSDLSNVLEDMLQSGYYISGASAEELGAIAKLLDGIAPGAGRKVLDDYAKSGYALGFAPEQHMIRRSVAKASDDGAEFFDEPIAPFLDTTEDLMPGLDIGVDTFSRSAIRKITDKWLTPIGSKVVENEQLNNAIDLVTDGGGTIMQARRLFNKLNQLAIQKKTTPRALITDEAALRTAMQDALGPDFQNIVDKIGKGDPRRLVMKIYAGSKEVVGGTQAFTGRLKTYVPALAIVTDVMYPWMKFRVNPLFYIQEAIESPFFNYMRGIQRQLTGPQYAAKYSWAKYLPWVDTKVGQKLGLAKKLETPIVEPEVAALALGSGEAAIRADLDIGESVIFLQGSEAAKLHATEHGGVVKRVLLEGINRGPLAIIQRVMNPYPAKNAAKLTMTMNLALEKMADDIMFKFPQQWVAMTKTYGTTNPRAVMINLIQDQARGWVSPVKVIDGARPRNFAFASKASLTKVPVLTEVSTKLDEIADGTKYAKVSEDGIVTLDVDLLKQDVMFLRAKLDEVAETGVDVTMAKASVQKLFGTLYKESVDKAAVTNLAKSGSLAAKESITTIGQSIKDWTLVNRAVKKLFKKESIQGFSREKIAASLAEFRSYGQDLPGMEAVLTALRKGEKLTPELQRALELSVSTLLMKHGPEEVLLGGLREVVKDANDVANRIHFYNPRRSAFERTLNHPFLAMYPLSYMVGKVVPEFARALFVKFPFTNRTRPFAGYEMVHEIQEHITVMSESDPKVSEFLGKSDVVFLLKQLFPGVPSDIGVSAPRWVNRTYAQYQRSQRPGVNGREPAQFDPFYAMRALAEQGREQGVFGAMEYAGGAASEIWDFFDGPVDFNETGN